MLIGLDSASVNESRAIREAAFRPQRGASKMMQSQNKMPAQRVKAVVRFVLRQVHGATAGGGDAFAGPMREQG